MDVEQGFPRVVAHTLLNPWFFFLKTIHFEAGAPMGQPHLKTNPSLHWEMNPLSAIRCPIREFGTSLWEEPHSPDVNNCASINFD